MLMLAALAALAVLAALAALPPPLRGEPLDLAAQWPPSMPAERASVEMHGGPDYVAPEKNLRKKRNPRRSNRNGREKRETG